MSGKHTPEPWRVGDRSTIVYCNDGFAVANATVFHGRHEPDTSEANARRIEACVNACAGIPTDMLERFKAIVGAMDEVSKIEKQRDELLALLEEAVSYTSCQAWSPSLTQEIEAAIANVKGTAA